MKIRVYHQLYGCETGCCGHVIEIDDSHKHFEFIHRYDSTPLEEWAISLAQHVVRERWPECYDSIDWSSVDYSEAEL